MKIQEIRVEGYRSLKNVVWRPDALNVLIGPNGGGKTNLVNVLELLSVCARGPLDDHVKASGGFQSLLWDRSPGGEIGVSAKTTGPVLDLGKLLSLRMDNLQDDTFNYAIKLAGVVKTSWYFILEETLDHFLSSEPNENKSRMGLIGRDLTGATVFSQERGKLVPMQEDLGGDQTCISSVSHWLSPVVAEFKSAMASWRVYQDFRTNLDAPVRQPALVRYEKTVAADGQNLIAVLHTLYSENETFKEEIDAAMQAVFGDAFKEIRFSPAADKYIQMKVRWRHLKNPIPSGDLSDGTLRFLFLITILANPDPPPLIVIEEPEIGLHPRMMAVVAEFAAQAAERSQVIFTTHSPEFLSAFRDKPPTTTVCESREGETVVRKVSGEDLEYWLKNYTLGELFTSGQLESFE